MYLAVQMFNKMALDLRWFWKSCGNTWQFYSFFWLEVEILLGLYEDAWWSIYWKSYLKSIRDFQKGLSFAIYLSVYTAIRPHGHSR